MEHDLAKWLAGEMTQNELEQFRKTPEFRDYQRIASFSAQLTTNELNEDEILRSVMSLKKTPRVVPMFARPVFTIGIAAALILAIGLFLLFRPAEVPVTEIASNGGTTHALLPDRSEVALQSGSSIEYQASQWDEHRSLQLKGEAYFKVAKGKKFDVKTALGTVTVVGTQFNVKVRETRFEVECYEGKVRVKNGVNELLLIKGQYVIFERNAKILSGSTAGTAPDWTKGELRFHSAALHEVIAELERVYDVNIDQNAATQSTFTGSLPGRDLPRALNFLCTTYDLEAQTIGKKIVLSANE